MKKWDSVYICAFRTPEVGMSLPERSKTFFSTEGYTLFVWYRCFTLFMLTTLEYLTQLVINWQFNHLKKDILDKKFCLFLFSGKVRDLFWIFFNCFVNFCCQANDELTGWQIGVSPISLKPDEFVKILPRNNVCCGECLISCFKPG